MRNPLAFEGDLQVLATRFNRDIPSRKARKERMKSLLQSSYTIFILVANDKALGTKEAKVRSKIYYIGDSLLK